MDKPAYIVVESNNTKDLMAMVNQNLAAGYLCMGGIAIQAICGQSVWYYQAMVKSSAYGA